LHAVALRFPHPSDGRPVTVRARLPPERAAQLAALVDFTED
jgi:hypothetical protein